MNWCYSFINLQQKAIFSKNWGGPEKDRFFLDFLSFFIFFLVFFQSFGFKVGPLLSSFFFLPLLFLFFLLFFFFFLLFSSLFLPLDSGSPTNPAMQGLR